MGTTELSARKKEAGFTLVELAVVMIIIGLLIGGVLKGQELIANAQITGTAAAVKGIDAATTTFRDTYNAIPGDMANATTRLPNCNGTCAFDGGGNTRIDDTAVDAAQSGGAVDENVAFWGHLSAADLITGIDVNTGNDVFGETFPSAPIAGGFQVGFDATGTLGSNAASRAGHYLALHSSPGAAPDGTALNALQAARLDRKLDDGVPTSGTVFSGGAGDTCDADGDDIYDEAVGTSVCDLFIRFQN